jgi:hypothetical protein
MARLVVYSQSILKHIPAAERHNVVVPDSLVLAWMHLLMGLIMSTEDDGTWEEHLHVTHQLILKGLADMLSTLPAGDLLAFTTLRPMDLVSLFSLKLIKDSADGFISLTDSYSEYIKDLVSAKVELRCYITDFDV